MKRDVVITGCGLVSPLGMSREALWTALSAGQSGIRPLGGIPTDPLPTPYGAEAKEFTGHINDFGPLSPPTKRAIRKGLKVMCREIQAGVAAAQRAIADARLALDQCDPDRVGVVYGSDYIMTTPEEFTEGVRHCLDDRGEFDFGCWPTKGLPQVTPLWLLKYLPNMPACHVAIYNDLRGPNNSLTVREASSNLALAEAACTIDRGSAEVIVAGATGSRIHPLRTVHTILQEPVATADGPPEGLSRPFDKGRSGMVVGEGAAAVIVEEKQFALRRGATLLGQILGYGSSAVANRRAVPDRRRALVNAMRQALQTAGLRPNQIGHIHAHGLSTIDSDREEAQAINDLFGPDHLADPVRVVAAKSYFGNLGAASGLVELIASLTALEQGELFPTLNYRHPDPECPVHVVAHREPTRGDCFLNINVTPQGQASAIIVRQIQS